MPYQISIEDEVLRISLSGRLTGRDLETTAGDIARCERNTVVPHRITDMTDATKLEIGFPDVVALAETRRRLKFPNSFKSAIIAPRSEQYGYARMFQTLNDNPQIAIRVFTNEAAARKWISSSKDLAREV